ncbi:2-amino-4-hydroxy-6-hydroxymethyldihydropteridine diphosphokinase [Faunimonas pinastri]|uniref:2-amino-4-hydroxy-6- hydroxymethyldihydropteridine diphosphokinase n=1 Tax=Faunimonas pinastri TaxID=1855383 RepID=UPI0015A6A2B8|nr:2-amino-4-hydroxy-6-hydroxymethyldihydropteridine diphosphokinase [Faunimonas pinastri]
MLGIGSNIDPEANSIRILARLIEKFGPVLVSRLYYTTPSGMVSDRRFVNFCAVIRTELAPEACKSVCVAIEAALGRDRSAPDCKVSDRPADIDLLLRLPSRNPDPRDVAGADYLLQPTRELLALLKGDDVPAAGERLCLLRKLPDAPATIDRDDRGCLVVVGEDRLGGERDGLHAAFRAE